MQQVIKDGVMLIVMLLCAMFVIEANAADFEFKDGHSTVTILERTLERDGSFIMYSKSTSGEIELISGRVSGCDKGYGLLEMFDPEKDKAGYKKLWVKGVKTELSGITLFVCSTILRKPK
jgi:hypothetical protein